MQRFYILYFLCHSLFAVAQPNYLWSISGGSADSDFATSCATDSEGNVYTTGRFQGIVDFDPGPGIYTLNSSSPQLFIAKYNSSGDFLWAKQFSGNHCAADKLSVDGDGDIYITGYFGGTTDFDPGSGSFEMITAGNSDVFICKLTTDGDFLWAVQAGAEHNDAAYDITTDTAGNVFVCGQFYGTSDFDPGKNTYNLTSEGLMDCFIWKLSAEGKLIWAKAIAGPSTQMGSSIYISKDNFIYITGSTYGIADFDLSPAIYNLPVYGNSDLFLCKYTAAGDLLWATVIGGSNIEASEDLAVDTLGNVFVCGWFLSQRTDFDPGVDSCIKNATNGCGFVTKFDSLGNFIWADQFGTWNTRVRSIVSGQDKIYFTGNYAGSADFDPGSGIHTLSSNGNDDIFICQFHSNGNFECAESVGGTGNDASTNISIHENNMFISGYFNDAVDFDPSASTSGHNSNGSNDMFIVKMETCGPVVSNPENENTLSAIKIFPNPASQFIFQSETTGEYSAVLFSSTGVAINTFILKNKGLIDLREYSKGIYFLKLHSGNRSYTRKIIVE